MVPSGKARVRPRTDITGHLPREQDIVARGQLDEETRTYGVGVGARTTPEHTPIPRKTEAVRLFGLSSIHRGERRAGLSGSPRGPIQWRWNRKVTLGPG